MTLLMEVTVSVKL